MGESFFLQVRHRLNSPYDGLLRFRCNKNLRLCRNRSKKGVSICLMKHQSHHDTRQKLNLPPWVKRFDLSSFRAEYPRSLLHQLHRQLAHYMALLEVVGAFVGFIKVSENAQKNLIRAGRMPDDVFHGGVSGRMVFGHIGC